LKAERKAKLRTGIPEEEWCLPNLSASTNLFEGLYTFVFAILGSHLLERRLRISVRSRISSFHKHRICDKWKMDLSLDTG
jgi:hypothetical protein